MIPVTFVGDHEPFLCGGAPCPRSRRSRIVVVDTNVVANLVLPSQHTPAARATLTRNPAWAAPLLWRSELRNVLSLYVCQGHVALAKGIAIQGAAEALLEGRENSVESREVLTLAHESGCAASDCEFVAVAFALGVCHSSPPTNVCCRAPPVAIDIRQFGADQ